MDAAAGFRRLAHSFSDLLERKVFLPMTLIQEPTPRLCHDVWNLAGFTSNSDSPTIPTGTPVFSSETAAGNSRFHQRLSNDPCPDGNARWEVLIDAARKLGPRNAAWLFDNYNANPALAESKRLPDFEKSAAVGYGWLERAPRSVQEFVWSDLLESWRGREDRWHPMRFWPAGLEWQAWCVAVFELAAIGTLSPEVPEQSEHDPFSHGMISLLKSALEIGEETAAEFIARHRGHGFWCELSPEAASWWRGEHFRTDGCVRVTNGEVRPSILQLHRSELPHKLPETLVCHLDDVVIASVRACEYLADLCEVTERVKSDGKISHFKQRKRRRHAAHPKALTARQAEAMTLYAECQSNTAEVARRMKITYWAARDLVEAAFTKIGQSVPTKPKTTALKRDRRGQLDVSDTDDRRQ